METKVNQISQVEYELVLDAAPEALAEEIEEAVRTQRGRTQLKGFRPGKVPANLVKKMYGKALAYGVAEKVVQEAYEREIVGSGEYKVLGSPRITELSYEMDGDLHAVIRFGVRPDVEIGDLSGERIPKLVQEVRDEDIEKAIDRLRRREANLVPSDEPAGLEDQLVVDMQQIDEESGTPIIGKREEDVTFFLDDERVHDELREGLQGKKAGDSIRLDIPHGSGEHVHTHRYEVTVKEVKRRELPEVDDDFVKEVTKERVSTVDELKEELRSQMETEWKRESREMFEGLMMERLLELHPVPVPESAIEMFLDYFVEDIKQRNEKKLPEDFNEEAFRRANRNEAEQQARWMLIRDALIESENLEVTEEDLDAYFAEASGGDENVTPALLRQYYQSMGLLDRVRQQKLSERVFEALQQRFDVVELDSEAFEAEMKERAERQNVEPDPVAPALEETVEESAADAVTSDRPEEG